MQDSEHLGKTITIRLDLAYHGRNFSGWQIQPDQVSVQGELMKALKVLYKMDLHVIGAGRTDAGVHAEQQVAHFKLPSDAKGPSLTQLSRSLNALTPHELLVLSAEPVCDDFHARFNPHVKTYAYHFDLHDRPHPLLLDRAAHVRVSSQELDRMQTFCRSLVGTHDFASYCSAQNETETTRRTILKAELIQHHQHHWSFEIQGKGFLQHMVRILAGTLVGIGQGKVTLGIALEALKQGQGFRDQLGITLPAHGLCLMKTEYHQQDYWE